MALNPGSARKNAKFVRPGGNKPRIVTRYDGVVSAPSPRFKQTRPSGPSRQRPGSKRRRDNRRMRQGRMP